jgi:hypothetical protein
MAFQSLIFDKLFLSLSVDSSGGPILSWCHFTPCSCHLPFSNAVPSRLYFIQQLNSTRQLNGFVLDGLDSVARHWQRIRQWFPDRKPPTLYGSGLYRMHTIGAWGWLLSASDMYMPWQHSVMRLSSQDRRKLYVGFHQHREGHTRSVRHWIPTPCL